MLYYTTWNCLKLMCQEVSLQLLGQFLGELQHFFHYLLLSKWLGGTYFYIRIDRKLTRPACLGCRMFFNSCFLHSVYVRAPAIAWQKLSSASLPVAGHNNDCDGA